MLFRSDRKRRSVISFENMVRGDQKARLFFSSGDADPNASICGMVMKFEVSCGQVDDLDQTGKGTYLVGLIGIDGTGSFLKKGKFVKGKFVAQSGERQKNGFAHFSVHEVR